MRGSRTYPVLTFTGEVRAMSGVTAGAVTAGAGGIDPGGIIAGIPGGRMGWPRPGKSPLRSMMRKSVT